MNLLLDTQTLLWWREGNRKLGPRARRAIGVGASTVRISAATVWELAIKVGAGRLELKHSLDLWTADALEERAFEPLEVTIAHALAVASLPNHHSDPFDRILIAQARLENLTIVTSDAAFDDYDVRRLDARS